MFDYSLSVLSPYYLLLLLLAPVLWIASFHSLSGLGSTRRIMALAFRTLVLLLIVLALADVQLVRSSDRLTTIYLIDQSRSIPEAQRRAMVEYVNRAIAQQRVGRDRAGVIVFGGNAAIEIPPFDDLVQITPGLDAARQIDPQYTDLAAAIKLAMASFPEDAAKRIVIVTDGNENRGNALDVARSAAEAGIGIDVLPVEYDYASEVLVESLTMPPDVRKDQPFDLRVVLNNTAQATDEDDGHVTGRLIISQTIDGRTEVLNPDNANQKITLKPGKSVFTIRQQIAQPNFYKFEARFVPDDPRFDPIADNNEATALVHVAGAARVLLIESEDPMLRGEHDFFVDHLRRQNLEVTVLPANQSFNSLAELQQYDSVILANVPREQFDEERIKILVRNVHDTGGGLVMLGGSNSFGAGGWANTPLEEAMPVDFHIKAAQVVPKGALALIMHASEMDMGNHWQKVIAKEAVKALGQQDLCGVLHWLGNDQWLWKHPIGLMPVGANRNMMLQRIDQMVPGDMPQFDPAMQMAVKAFKPIDAAIKHMIIISDGDPAEPANSTLAALKNLKVTVTTVAVGSHGILGNQIMQKIATTTGGKYYVVQNANTLPKIFQQEARRVARPLIYENKETPFSPRVVYETELVRGFPINTELPPITGYVMTTVKDNKLVEVAMTAPLPAGQATEANRTILAHWRYGLGKSVAFTTDVGQRWATSWANSEIYDKLMSQLVRGSMRPTGDTGKYTVATRVENGQVKVIVTAMNQENEFLNFQSMAMTVIRPGPEAKAETIKLEQDAPGRYVGTFQADDTGSYIMAVVPGVGEAPIRTGIDVPYSDEFRVQETNQALIESLAALEPRGGQKGLVIQNIRETGEMDGLLEAVDTYRHTLAKATSSQDAWYWMVFAAGLVFFADVFNRRVTVEFGWVPPLAARAYAALMRRKPPPKSTEFMERLKSSKASVDERIASTRASARYEPTADPAAYEKAVEEASAPTGPSEVKPPPRPASGGLSPIADKEPESYTERLLKAKRKVWEEKDKDKDKDKK